MFRPKNDTPVYDFTKAVDYIQKKTGYDERTIKNILKVNDYYLRDEVGVLNESDKEIEEDWK